jgi:hypothetical protein
MALDKQIMSTHFYLQKRCFMWLICVSFSALTLQFVKHRFLDYHDPTIGKKKKSNEIDVVLYILYVWFNSG